MAKLTARGYTMADDLFEALYLRKTALKGSRPNCLPFEVLVDVDVLGLDVYRR
jgi:hypothetical protein